MRRHRRSKPSAVHAVTGGNPFFVTEVAKDPDLPAARRRCATRCWPARPRCTRRTSRCSSSSRPRRTGSTTGCCRRSASTCRRCGGCEETGLLTRDRRGLVFRHELARQAVESTIPPGGGPRLHARLLDALERVEPRDPAVLTHHAVAARDAARAASVCPGGRGRRRSGPGAHTEAAAFFADRAGALDGDAPRERAELLAAAGLRAVHDQPAAATRSTTSARRSRCGSRPVTRRACPRRTSRRRSSSTTTLGAGRPRSTRSGRPRSPTDAGAEVGLRRCPGDPGLPRLHARRLRTGSSALRRGRPGRRRAARGRSSRPAQRGLRRPRSRLARGDDEARL